jgi:hypothetical protein
MIAAPGPAAGREDSGWFAQRFTIIADDEPSTEPPEDQPPPGAPVRRAWASLFLDSGGFWPPRLEGPSGPAATRRVSASLKKLVLVDKLEGASKWAAAGFSSVTALLLFFGVKEGVLDQAIRLDPFATLCVFLLLGVGVLCALFANAINPVKRIHLWALLAAIAAMLVLTAVFLPNLDSFKGAEEEVKKALSEGAPATATGILARVNSWVWVLIAAVAALALVVSFVRLRGPSTGNGWEVAILVLSGLLIGAGFNLLTKDARARVIFLIVALAFLAFPVFLVRSMDKDARRWWDVAFLLLSSGILLTAAGFAIANASRQTLLSVAAGALLLGATAWSFAHKASLPAVAGVIILGVAATSLGLYGAAKVSVGTKITAVTPQVSAALEQEGGQTVLKIVAVASRMRDTKLLLIWVAGTPRIQRVQAPARLVTDLRDGMGAGLRDGMGTGPGEIWRSVLQPNSLDEINTTVTIPLTPTRWERVTVSHCQVDKPPTDEWKPSCIEKTESQDLQLGTLTPDAGAEITGHIVATSAKSLKVTLTGRNVTWGSQIQAEICRAHNGGHARQLAYATLTPDVTGAVTWNVPVPAGGNGDELILQYRQCPGGNCPDPRKPPKMTQLAKYVLP